MTETTGRRTMAGAGGPGLGVRLAAIPAAAFSSVAINIVNIAQISTVQITAIGQIRVIVNAINRLKRSGLSI